MPTYEYQAIENPTPLQDHVLNALGKQGWRLVGFAILKSNHAPYHYVFMRPA